MSKDPVALDRFRTCGSCRREWPTAAEFLGHPTVTVVGLQEDTHLPAAHQLVFGPTSG